MLAAVAQQRPVQPPPASQEPASIEGEVRNSVTGEPIERAHVAANLGNQQRYGTYTDAAGKFTIPGLPPASYMITLDRVGYVTPSTGVASNVSLHAGQKYQNLKLKLTPTGSIVGRVLDADGQPMEGIVVRSEVGGQTIRTATTDDRGMYRIGGQRPGKVRIAAEVLNLPFPPEIRTDGTVEAHYSPTYHPGALDAQSAMRVTVGPATEVTGVDIKMIRTALIHVAGKVTGMPPGAKGGYIQVQPNTSRMGTQVRPDGTFEILRANPGKYTLSVDVNMDGQSGRYSSGPVPVTVGDHDIDNFQIQLYQTADLKGQILYEDEEAAKPNLPPPGSRTQMPPRHLILLPADTNRMGNFSQMGNFSAEIKEDGSFTIARLTPGSFRASIPWFGASGASGTQGVTTGTTNYSSGHVYVKSMSLGRTNFDGDKLDLLTGVQGETPLIVHVATARSVLSGSVRNDKDEPEAGLHVVLAEQSLSRGATAQTNTKEDGSYSFEGIAPGKYRLFVVDDADRDEIQVSLESFDEIAVKLDVGEHDTLVKDLKRKP
jgi:hypothetical protein